MSSDHNGLFNPNPINLNFKNCNPEISNHANGTVCEVECKRGSSTVQEV